MIFCSVKLKCPEHRSINPSSTIHLKKIWNTNTSVAGLQPVMRFTVWSENYDQCFKKSKKILKLKTFSVCRLPWRHAHPDRSAVTMQSEQKRCRHSLVVMVFFSMSRQMGHISSLCRERGDTATSVPSMIASWTHTHTHFYNNITSHITVTTGESRDMKDPKNYVWPTFPEQMEKEREMSSVLGGTADGDTTRGRHVNISYVDFQVRSKKQKQSLLLNVAS